jgi:3'-5' exoribonuclease
VLQHTGMDLHAIPLRAADVPQARFDTDDLFAEVRAFCSEVRDGHVRALLLGLLDDPELGPAFRKAPAAKTIHHAWTGGLCEHTLSVLQLGWRVCDHYPRLDRDLVTAGCLLHDFGKVRELACEGDGFTYTDEGRLVGHIVLACQLIHERAARIAGFPRELEMHLVHLVAAHHGSLEHGSPKEPQTLEAVVVHALDELDSRIAAFSALFERDATPGSFTSFQRLYDRHLFKLPSWNGEPPIPDSRRFRGPGLYDRPEASPPSDAPEARSSGSR